MQRISEQIEGVSFDLIQVPGGCYRMGSPRYFTGEELGQREVSVRPFYMAETLTTQKLWKVVASLPKVRIVLDPDPSDFRGEEFPVNWVNFWEVQEFCDRLRNKTGRPYRLATEPEWEYACRAGTNTFFSFGDFPAGEANIQGSGSTPVKAYPPNPFGFYDMHGNLWEWCDEPENRKGDRGRLDRLVERLTQDCPKQFPIRGGAWNEEPQICSSYSRMMWSSDSSSSSIGFRLCLSA